MGFYDTSLKKDANGKIKAVTCRSYWRLPGNRNTKKKKKKSNGKKKDSNGTAAAAAAASNIYSLPFGLVMYTAWRIASVLVL